MKRIASDYIHYMELKLKYFEKEANALFGRNIKHILLIHASKLNADYLDALAKMFLDNNYQFISLDDALQDKAYQTPVTIYTKRGISWIDRWALSQGKNGDFFKGDPQVNDYIKKMAE